MTILATGDLHLDDNPRNRDRWNIFPWLRDQAKRYEVRTIVLLGDVTDAKDRHSAILVNRLIGELESLSRLAEIYWVMGNHDRLDENTPFFRFLDRGAQGTDQHPIHYINKPYREGAYTFLPHTRNWSEDWKSFDELSDSLGADIGRCDYIFCHQTFDGCKAENGTALEGIPPSFFKGYQGWVISGDIHVPQIIGKNILYAGAPYRVHFGDSFKPRVLLLEKSGMKDLYFPGKERLLMAVKSFEQLEQAEATMGAQVKVRMSLKRADLPEWPAMRKRIKELAAERGWEIVGIECMAAMERASRVVTADKAALKPEEALAAYIASKRLEKPLAAAGMEFLKEAKS
jgi:DNA repair exonuclease SbcCD nuclease subunit